MMLKYCFAFVCIAFLANAFEFQNMQVVNYDEKSSQYFGAIDLGSFKKIGEKYYKIETRMKMGWREAYFACRKDKSYLATITSMEQLETLTTYLTELDKNAIYYWVGGIKLLNDGVFRWIDSGEIVSDGLWDEGEPNNASGNEKCVQLTKFKSKIFYLDDKECTTKISFICERDNPKAVTFIGW